MSEKIPAIDSALFALSHSEHEKATHRSTSRLESTGTALQFGPNWHLMLKRLADAEVLVDVYLGANAYGNPNDRDLMEEETHGVRIIYVGEDYFVVGPRRPVHSSIIPLGWVSMIRFRSDDEVGEILSLVGDVEELEEVVD
jgi:hypothetical protein